MNGLFIVLFWLSLFFNLVKTSKSGNPSDSVNLAQQVLVPGELWVCSLPLGKGSLQLSINMAQLDVRPGPSGLSVHASITVAVDIAGNGHSMNGSSDSIPKRPRKRSRRPENWKRNVIKYKQARSEQYVSPSTGKTVPAKTTGNPCSCKNHCFDLFTEEERETILESFILCLVQ